MKYINLLILSVFLGCGENESESKLLKKQKEKYVKEQKQSVKLELIKNYNPIVGWDSTKVFTYWYQENLCAEPIKIAFEGILKDIIKIDSANYAVKLYARKKSSIDSDDRAFLLECRISQQQKATLEKELKHDKGFFIIKVETVNTHFPAIRSEDQGEGDFYLDYDFDEKLIVFKGYLIDFRLYEN